MSMAGALTGAVTVLLAEIVRQVSTLTAARARARRSGDLTIYALTPAGRLVFGAAILIMGGLAALVIYHGEARPIAALLAGFTLLCVLAYPGAIVVDPAFGVRTRRWYGRPGAIAWYELAKLHRAEGIGQTTIVSTDGRKIVHTSLHADSAGFCAQVARCAPHGAPHQPGR